jgi:hypothetical protein
MTFLHSFRAPKESTMTTPDLITGNTWNLEIADDGSFVRRATADSLQARKSVAGEDR